MEPNRWYLLRHPKGFDDGRFTGFAAGCAAWRARLEAMASDWPHEGIPRPQYDFGAPELSEDRQVVSVALGGDVSYGALKLNEDLYPEDLYQFLPAAFAKELERGRRDTLGWFPEVSWYPLRLDEDLDHPAPRTHPPRKESVLARLLGFWRIRR